MLRKNCRLESSACRRCTGCRTEQLEARRLAAAHPPLLRIGVLGDSYSDEYQFYPPDRSHARNWVEQLANHRDASFGAFSRHSRGTPRNKGYADDWALSGATTSDLPAQTSGVAAQAAAGEIDFATILIGGNDMLDQLESAAISPAAAASAPGSIIAAASAVTSRIETAVDTILAASANVRVVVTTLPPVSQLPLVAKAEAAGLLPAATAAALVNDADNAELQINAAITAFANDDAPRIAIADFAATATAFTAPTLRLGKTSISTTLTGDGPRHLFLADGIHPGTVGQALLANTIVQAIDSHFGESIQPLTTRQILADARLPI